MTSMFVGHNIIELSSVDSTNTYLNNLAQQMKLPEGTLIRANHQINGRGQRENNWLSTAGKSLCISILLYPIVDLNRQFLFNKCISLAICQTLNNYDISAKIKWPNDVYVKQRKISGLLIENTISGNKLMRSVIGIGINVNNELDEMPSAISLKECVGKQVMIDDLLISLCENIEKNYFLFKRNSKSINHHYHENLFKKGEVQTFTSKNETFQAIIESVNDLGQLVLLKDNERVSYAVGDVRFMI